MNFIHKLFSSKHIPSSSQSKDCIDGDHTDWQPLFHVSKQQREAASKWFEEHRKDHGQITAIGGAYTWCFTPTSLGVATSIKCSCGDTLNISNYSEW